MTEVSELDDMVYMLVQEEENDEFDFVRSNLQWKNKYVYVQKKQTKILELRKEDRVRANPLRAVRMGVVRDRNHVRGGGGKEAISGILENTI